MPDPLTPDQLGNVLVKILKNGSETAGLYNAKAMLAAASAFIRDAYGEKYAKEVLKSAAVGIDNIEALIHCAPSPAGAN